MFTRNLLDAESIFLQLHKDKTGVIVLSSKEAQLEPKLRQFSGKGTCPVKYFGQKFGTLAKN